MIINYFITAIHNISIFKLHSITNISRHAIGILMFTFIMVYETSELTYKKYHENYEKINQLCVENDLTTTAHLGYMLAEKFPEFKYLVQNDINNGGGEKAYIKILDSDMNIEFENIIHAVPDFFKVFNIKIIAGDISKILTNPYTIVLTESSALKLFGNTNVVNKTIVFIGDEGSLSHKLTIAAIIADAPKNSSIKYSAITSFIALNNIKPMDAEVDQDDFNWKYSTFAMTFDD